MAARKTPQPPARPRWYSRPIVWKSVLVLFLVSLAWLIYLDAQVRYKFEGKRWALPAQVYARALEIYDGRALNARLLEHELRLLHYREVPRLTGPGQYRRRGEVFDIWRRQHVLPDGEHEDLRLSFRLHNDVVSALQSPDVATTFVTLEPFKIGGIYPASQEEREVLRYEHVPQLLIAALLATEDQHYFEHWGVSPVAIVRAMWANLRAGRVVQGGSTLTQQLVKNFYLSRERSLWRKANEAAMALMLEAHYSKEAILETYINDIFLGQAGSTAIHGFGMASRFYFGKTLEECHLDELALLVAIIKGPSYYNPRRYPERAKNRRDLVLRLMYEQGFIAEGAYRAWADTPLNVVAQPQFQHDRYPAFMDLVKRQLQQEYDDEDLRNEGLRIYTTLDPQVQEAMEQSARSTLTRLKQEDLQLGAVITGVGTGEVQALLGDRNPRFQGFNRALDASRPVGSLIKPAIYLRALMDPDRYHLLSRLQDQPFRLEFSNGDTWTPSNFDGESEGEVSLLDALSRSLNIPSARLGLELGVPAVEATLRTLGVSGEINPYPSLLLGAQSMTPFEVSKFYQTIASNGFNMPLRAIREVTTAQGESLSRYSIEIAQVIPPEAIYLLQHAMQQTMRTGTGKSAYRQLPEALNVAGKTGTTNDFRDSWFAGFSGDYLGVVWMGRDDNQSTNLTGASGALKLWTELFRRLPQYPLSMVKPGEVDYVWYDTERQVLTDPQCRGAQPVPVWGQAQGIEQAACQKGFTNFRSWLKSWF